MREVIPTPISGLDLRREYGHHQSPAIRAGGMVFCSGMVAIDPQSGERQHGTVTSEARRIFDNLKLLLESTGSSLDRLVQVHAMIYDRIEYDVLNRLYRQVCPERAAGPYRDECADRGRLQGHARRHRRGGNASAGGDDIFPTGDRTWRMVAARPAAFAGDTGG